MRIRPKTSCSVKTEAPLVSYIGQKMIAKSHHRKFTSNAMRDIFALDDAHYQGCCIFTPHKGGDPVDSST
jgi:hypothetical protein